MSDTVYEFKFPDVGEGLTEGKLIEWKVGIGDNIKTDQPLCSVETDKAVVDIPSPVTGKVIELLNKVDDTLIVGNVIITIDIGNDEKTIPDTNEEHEKQKIEQKNPFVPYIGTWTNQDLGKPGAYKKAIPGGFSTSYKNFIYVAEDDAKIKGKNPKDNPEAFGKTL